MTPPPDVAILTHAADRLFERTKYLIHAVSKEWEAIGLRVAVLRGVRAFVPAGVLIPHVDMTVMPPEYIAFARRYPRVLNRDVVDISKSSFSENIVGPGSPETGPVIVKTDRNHGGLPELRLEAMPRARLFFEKLRSRLVSMRSPRWRDVEVLDRGSYPVFPALKDVPREIFANPHLIVERYVAEIEGGRYCVRFCYALGSREFTVRLTSKNPVIKASTSEGCERVESSSEVALWRRRLGLDYGKIDYVVRDGKAVVLDVNTTPAYSALERYGLTGAVARELAEGIRESEATP